MVVAVVFVGFVAVAVVFVGFIVVHFFAVVLVLNKPVWLGKLHFWLVINKRLTK